MTKPPENISIDAIDAAFERSESAYQVLGSIKVLDDPDKWAAQFETCMSEHFAAMSLIKQRLGISE